MHITQTPNVVKMHGLSNTEKIIDALCTEGAFDRVEEVWQEVACDHRCV